MSVPITSNTLKNLQLCIIFCKINWMLHRILKYLKELLVILSEISFYLLILIRNINCLWYYKFLKQVYINIEEICSSWKTSFLFQLIIPSVKHLFPRESFVSFSARALYYTTFFSLHFICIECESGKMSQGKIIQV